MKKKSTKETPTKLSKSYVIEAFRFDLEDEEEADQDVSVRFDGYRLGLEFDDGSEYLIIFDRLLSALNELAEEAGWEEQGVEELEQLAKTARKVLSAKK